MRKKIVEISEQELVDIIEDAVNEVIAHDSNQCINEMARIRQSKSGLPMLVWLNPNYGTNTGQHNKPRIKFQDNTSNRIIPNELIPISIDPADPIILVKDYKPKLPSQAIAQLKDWIVRNHATLLDYWNNEIYEDELIERLK